MQINNSGSFPLKGGLMNNYFRITAYNPEKDYCFIADSYGKFEKIWQFSSCLVHKGYKIIAVSNESKFNPGNMPKATEDNDHIIIRACDKGKPIIDGNKIKIGDYEYTTI